MQERTLFLKANDTNDLLPDLYYDMLLAEERYPVFFTCTTREEERTFFFSCCHMGPDLVRWVAAETPLSRLERLLTNEISIRDVFGCGDDVAYVISRTNRGFSVEANAVSKLPPRFLPTPGYYMDAEEGEFDEELEILRQRAQLRTRAESETQISLNATSFLSDVDIQLPGFYAHCVDAFSKRSVSFQTLLERVG